MKAKKSHIKEVYIVATIAIIVLASVMPIFLILLPVIIIYFFNRRFVKSVNIRKIIWIVYVIILSFLILERIF